MITRESLDCHRALAAQLTPHAPLSADLLRRVLREVESGSPLGELFSTHPDANAPLFIGRALAGVNYLLLAGQAPALADHVRGYLSRHRDAAFPERTWELWQQAVLSHPRALREALDRPVQQHHPRRAGMLVRGLAMLAEPQVRLLELGACAGLTLIPDAYCWIGDNGTWGDPDSALRLAAPRGPLPSGVRIVERAGCDLQPRQAADPRDALVLLSFHLEELAAERMELMDAMALAVARDITIDQADAVSWLTAMLDDRGPAGVCTVVWHSFFRGFLPPAEQEALEDVMRRAARRMRLALISLEPPDLTEPAQLTVRLYS
jgi:hypothetical protein